MHRMKKAMNFLNKKNVECGIVLKPENIFYLTGFFPTAFSALLLKEEPLLLVSKMDGTLAESAEIEYKVMEKIEREFKKIKFKNVGIEKKYASVSFYEKYLKGKRVYDLNFIEKMRSIKDKEEIKNIQKAIGITESAIKKVGLLEGKTEIEVKAFLEYQVKNRAFEIIVASGRNSAVPHHRSGNKIIKRGDVVIIDAGARVNNYYSDITRTFNGESKIYDAVLEAQKAAITECYDGGAIKNADIAARKVFKEYGLEKFFVHSTGHGIGLEVHEIPKISNDAKGKFRKGMVVTVEPGIYKDSGARIEDMVLIGKKPKILTRLPK